MPLGRPMKQYPNSCGERSSYMISMHLRTHISPLRTHASPGASTTLCFLISAKLKEEGEETREEPQEERNRRSRWRRGRARRECLLMHNLRLGHLCTYNAYPLQCQIAAPEQRSGREKNPRKNRKGVVEGSRGCCQVCSSRESCFFSGVPVLILLDVPCARIQVEPGVTY